MREGLFEGAFGEKLGEIVDMLKTTGDGDMTITLAGAHAKGLDDQLSDIDIYMYYADPKPSETNKRIVEAFADGHSAYVTADHVSAEYGGCYIFHYKGTLVEVTTRLYENALKRIHDSLEGRFEIIPNDWTINGYYTFTYASEVSYVIPVWDPPRFIENTRKIVFPYPVKLKRKILEEFGGRMKSAPFTNNEYVNAIQRRDLFMANFFVDTTLLNMVQVIYALNDAYFTGDKQIVKKLAALPYCPAKLLENIAFLLSTPDDCGQLERQRELLREIIQELDNKMESMPT